jgi:hypothetical protein
MFFIQFSFFCLKSNWHDCGLTFANDNHNKQRRKKMKRQYLIIAALLFTSVFAACNDGSSMTSANNSFQNIETDEIYKEINSLPTSELSSDVAEGLIFMREEEKLARDVYLYFYEKYNIPIFKNISKSESVHMKALKFLLDKYELEDPVIDDAIGQFQNKELANLFNQLTKAGDVSLVEALKIGLTIEDLDIRDLMGYETSITNEDVIYVYDRLTRGSRNHLRAYNRLTLRNGGTYEAQFITQELFDEIINSPHERGRW